MKTMMNAIRSILKEPLVHFLALSIGLFALHAAVSHEENDVKRIVVDEDSLLSFIQYRTKSFEPVTAKQQLQSFSQTELLRVIDDYVREEALYREARTLGLGENDYVIKRRLIQKIDYVARGFAESLGQVSDQEISEFFENNKENYYRQPRITFTHVYFGFDRHGRDGARSRAERKLAELQAARVGFNDASRHGERFIYGLNYVERSELYVASHFGDALTEQVFALEPDLSSWHGPYLSDHGAHLVMVAHKQEGRMPALEEVRARVAKEAQRQLAAERAREATQQIVDGYDVDIVYRQPDAKLARFDATASSGRESR